MSNKGVRLERDEENSPLSRSPGLRLAGVGRLKEGNNVGEKIASAASFAASSSPAGKKISKM